MPVRSARAGPPRPPQQAVTSAPHTTKYKNLKEGKNADYIPALAKVDPESVRHRARDGRRKGLHGRRHQDRSLDPVDLEGVHDGARDSGLGRQAIENNMGVDATGQVFNSIVAIEQHKGQRDEPAREPGCDHDDRAWSAARRPTTMWAKIIGHVRRLRRSSADRARGRVQVGGGDQSAQSGHRRC